MRRLHDDWRMERNAGDASLVRPMVRLAACDLCVLPRIYFCRGGTRCSPALISLPDRFAPIASSRTRAALRTSSWIAWSASNSS